MSDEDVIALWARAYDEALNHAVTALKYSSEEAAAYAHERADFACKDHPQFIGGTL